MDRREVLRDLSGLALVGPLAAAESIRQTRTRRRCWLIFWPTSA
jgi:hypothetical protein